MFKVNFHSAVNLITNSSTVIFTYQNSVNECKDLVNEILKLCGIKDKTAEDVFYYGVYHSAEEYSNRYVDEDEEEEEEEHVEQQREELTVESVNRTIEAVLKGEIEVPEWLSEDVENYNGYTESKYLYLIPKEEKYKELANKIKSLLFSVDADGGRDG